MLAMAGQYHPCPYPSPSPGIPWIGGSDREAHAAHAHAAAAAGAVTGAVAGAVPEAEHGGAATAC